MPYDLDISPDGRLLSASVAEVNGDQFLRVWDLAKVLQRRREPLSRIPLRPVGARELRVLAGRPLSLRQQLLHRRLEHLPLRGRDRRVEAVSNAETGFFRPVPLADGRLIVLNYTAEGFVPAIIEPHPLPTSARSSSSAPSSSNKYPEVKTWQVPPPSAVDDEKLITREGPYAPARARSALRERVSGVAGLQERDRASAITLNFEDPLAVREPRHHRRVHAGQQPATATSARTSTSSGATSTGAASLSWNRSDFYDLFGPTKRSRKGYAAKLGYDELLIFDEPRKLTLSYDLEYYDKIDTLPNAQNVGTPFTRLARRRRSGLHYTDVRRSLGAVDDEKGIAWDVVLKANHVERTRRRRSCAAASISASRCRFRIRRSGCAAPPASAPAIATIRSRTSTSAASATTTSTAARSSATANTTRCRASSIDEISGQSFVARDGRMEPAAGRVRIGRHAGAST